MDQHGQSSVHARRAAARAILLALAALLCAGLIPEGACSVVAASSAQRGMARHAAFYGHVFAIGDSVMLDAQGALQQRGITVDAVVGRQFFQGIDILQWMHSARRLPEAVVVGLGTNGPITGELFDQMMRAVQGVAVVVFVTVKEPRSWEGEVNAVLRAGVARWPRAQLADWYSLAVAHPEWFWGDGIHMRADGAGPYAQLVESAIGRGWARVRGPTAEVQARR